MLKYQLIHPQILEALGRAGHGAKVLIADGDFPFSTVLGPRAKLISLNLCPGVVDCTTVLRALTTAIPIEAAAVMDYPTAGPYALTEDPPIWAEFGRILQEAGVSVQLERLDRFKYYQASSGNDVALIIATSDVRPYANLLLTIGCVAE